MFRKCQYVNFPRKTITPAKIILDNHNPLCFFAMEGDTTMANVKPLESASQKWRERAQVSQEDYRRGVENTTKDWSANTRAGAAAYKAGMQAALNANRWEKGVQRAGSEKWKTQTMTKGPGRWAEGIALSGDAYTNGFAPFHAVLSSLQLKEKGAANSPQNYDRVRQVGNALHEKKIQLAGG